MGVMETADKSRPWWKLHFVTWIWFTTLVVGSFFVNAAIDWRPPPSFGWPLTFAEFFSQPLDPRETFPALAILPSNYRFTFDIPKLLCNLGLCLVVLLASTFKVEAWQRRFLIPRFRFSVRGLLLLTAWIGLSYLFFDYHNQRSFHEFFVAHRAREWSLFLEYIAVGIAIVGLFDLASRGLSAARTYVRSGN